MKYFVVMPDGQKFGPADIQTLNQWIGENRLNEDTMLESESNGSPIRASLVPGLLFRQAPAIPVSQPPSPASYFVLGQGGQKYGPADLATINSWASEGRITSATQLQDANNGVILSAGNVPGVNLGKTSQANPYASSAPAPSPYAAAPSNYPRQYGASTASNGDAQAVWSIVCSLLGVGCCPLLPLVGLGLAYSAKKKDAPLATTAIVIGWICFLVQMGYLLSNGLHIWSRFS